MSYDKFFPYSGGVSREFELFVQEHGSMLYRFSEEKTVIPGSLKIHLNPTHEYAEFQHTWGQFAQEGDSHIHWHLTITKEGRPKTIYKNQSLLRGTEILYTGVARHGHAKIPISPDLVIGKDKYGPFRQAERYHKQELESLLERLNFDS